MRIVRGLFRTMKLCLEARLGKFVPVNRALIPWLPQHVCIILNARSRGLDGLTPWARVKGRAFNQRLLCFAETILYKLPTKGPQSAPDGNVGTRWLEATFVGFSRASNAYVLITPENTVVTARSLYRRPMSNRWQGERLAQITATPWSTRDRPQTEVRFSEPAEAEEQKVLTPAVPVPRVFRINHSDLKRYGYTKGCLQCEHNEKYGRSKGGVQHSSGCRQRILEELSKTPGGPGSPRHLRGEGRQSDRRSHRGRGQGQGSSACSTATALRGPAAAPRAGRHRRVWQFQGASTAEQRPLGRHRLRRSDPRCTAASARVSRRATRRGFRRST